MVRVSQANLWLEKRCDRAVFLHSLLGSTSMGSQALKVWAETVAAKATTAADDSLENILDVGL